MEIHCVSVRKVFAVYSNDQYMYHYTLYQGQVTFFHSWYQQNKIKYQNKQNHFHLGEEEYSNQQNEQLWNTKKNIFSCFTSQ